MQSSLRRATRLALAVGTVAVAAAGFTVVTNLRSGDASTPSAYDYCVIVPEVWVHNTEVYSGGEVCVPFPFGSQPT